MGHGLAAASAVLAAFMGGLAAGAGAAGRYAGTLPPRRALTLYAALEIAIAVLAVLMPLLLIAVRPLLAATYADGHGGATFAFVRLASSVLLLCVPAACMGATFPIASRWIVRTASTAAQDAGGLYAANTLGAAAGAVMAGFALIPALGLRGTTFVGVGAEHHCGWRSVGARITRAHSTGDRNRREPGTGNREPERQERHASFRFPAPGSRLPARIALACRACSWRERLRIADAASRLDASAGADPRSHHLRLQHRRRGLHHRHRRRRRDRIATGRRARRVPPWDSPARCWSVRGWRWRRRQAWTGRS